MPLVKLCLFIFLFAVSGQYLYAQTPTVSIGSKAFNESHILAEIAAQLLEANDVVVERKLGLGGTLIAYTALQNNEIDLYPEYSGTISQVILKKPTQGFNTINSELATIELQLLEPLGFNNSYAIAIHNSVAKQNNIRTLSELASHPDLKVGVSLEFLNREDGWPALSKAYNLNHDVIGLEHALAYRAIENYEINATDAYTTDGDIDAYPIILLEDDQQFFPLYLAGYLTHTDLPDEVTGILNQLAGQIDEKTMRAMNAQVSLEKRNPADVAAEFLQSRGFITEVKNQPSTVKFIFEHTLTHIQLTAAALIMAALIALPLGIALSRIDSAAKISLYVTGLFQTIPALALLALLIPFTGLGKFTAIVALFLYSLLPILRNTLTGILTVEPQLKQVAAGIGLNQMQQLTRIELPLAAPTIIAGIKTAAIISIGTATLAAFVGAGGLGEPIITGLTLNNYALILQGAIPAAIFALLVELLFERIEARYTPKHLS